MIFNSDLSEDIKIIQQHLLTCASVPMQALSSKIFDLIKEKVRPQIKNIINKRRIVASGLRDYGFEVMEGDSTFYIFCTYPGVKDTNLYIKSALLAGVSYVPGGGYGEAFKSYMRVSVGTEDVESILAAIEKLALIFSGHQS